MNRKGFTLIEVIVVIVIIVLLSLILIPNVMLFVSKNNKDMCYKLKDNIESAAKMYVSENKYDLDIECDCEGMLERPAEEFIYHSYGIYISFKELVDAGKLSAPIRNPLEKDIIELEKEDEYFVKVGFDCKNKKFRYEVYGINCGDEVQSNVDNTEDDNANNEDDSQV